MALWRRTSSFDKSRTMKKKTTKMRTGTMTRMRTMTIGTMTATLSDHQPDLGKCFLGELPWVIR
jgi:hypothetical protein